MLFINFSVTFFFCSLLYSNETVTISSDYIAYDKKGTTLIASGNVRVQYGNYKLSTPELSYNKETKLLIAKQPIELKNKDSFKIIADSAQINDDFKEIIASHASALIEKTFYLKSQKMHRSKNGESTFYSIVGAECDIYTT